MTLQKMGIGWDIPDNTTRKCRKAYGIQRNGALPTREADSCLQHVLEWKKNSSSILTLKTPIGFTGKPQGALARCRGFCFACGFPTYPGVPLASVCLTSFIQRAVLAENRDLVYFPGMRTLKITPPPAPSSSKKITALSKFCLSSTRVSWSF